MQRHDFRSGGLRLSYLDDRGPGRPIAALHAHWLDAEGFGALAAALAPEYRLIALDQRGHGHSMHAARRGRRRPSRGRAFP
jgi:pimeloyl-ACP methyl ester carboxylesterase